MASVSENLVSSMDLTSKAVDKMNQITGGRDAIVQRATPGGSAVAGIVVDSLAQGSSGASEVGKGSNVNTSA